MFVLLLPPNSLCLLTRPSDLRLITPNMPRRHNSSAITSGPDPRIVLYGRARPQILVCPDILGSVWERRDDQRSRGKSCFAGLDPTPCSLSPQKLIKANFSFSIVSLEVSAIAPEPWLLIRPVCDGCHNQPSLVLLPTTAKSGVICLA